MKLSHPDGRYTSSHEKVVPASIVQFCLECLGFFFFLPVLVYSVERTDLAKGCKVSQANAMLRRDLSTI